MREAGPLQVINITNSVIHRLQLSAWRFVIASSTVCSASLTGRLPLITLSQTQHNIETRARRRYLDLPELAITATFAGLLVRLELAKTLRFTRLLERGYHHNQKLEWCIRSNALWEEMQTPVLCAPFVRDSSSVVFSTTRRHSQQSQIASIQAQGVLQEMYYFNESLSKDKSLMVAANVEINPVMLVALVRSSGPSAEAKHHILGRLPPFVSPFVLLGLDRFVLKAAAIQAAIDLLINAQLSKDQQTFSHGRLLRGGTA